MFELLNDYIFRRSYHFVPSSRGIVMEKVLAAALLTSMLLVIAVSTPSIFGLLNSTLTLTSVGTVTTVGVGAYWDEGCTNAVTMVNWGNIEPGESKKVLIYIKNEGSTPVTLSMNTTDWSPSSAENYMSLSWDYSGGQIAAGGAVRVTLTLTVSSSASGITSFTFDIIITGTG